jgi:pentatricopeptide repeat protein
MTHQSHSKLSLSATTLLSLSIMYLLSTAVLTRAFKQIKLNNDRSIRGLPLSRLFCTTPSTSITTSNNIGTSDYNNAITTTSTSISNITIESPANVAVAGKEALLRKNKSKKFPPRSTLKSIVSRDEIIQCVRTRDFDLAVTIYQRLIDSNSTPNSAIMYSLIGVCEKKEHLSYALLFFNALHKSGASPSEPAYLSLIRCYLDSGLIQDALSLVDSMIELGIPLKHRIFQHIVDYYRSTNDLENMMNILLKMINMGIYPRSDQLVALLHCCGVAGDLSSYKEAVSAILRETSKELVGLEYESIVSLRALYDGTSSSGSSDGSEDGVRSILVDSFDNIPGRIIERSGTSALSSNVCKLYTCRTVNTAFYCLVAKLLLAEYILLYYLGFLQCSCFS